jgi:AraC family transcriptional regulator of adaptative response/methylated-DNA-[protein]-cysteine methyltransferase
MDQLINYSKIAEAIHYIRDHHTQQPSLDEMAAAVNMSPFHFQRLFSEWAGISPKKFLQYINIGHAKDMLRKKQATLFDTTLAAGLSSPGRLHDLFVTIEGMTPAEYKNGGAELAINYSEYAGIFGNMLIASTKRGICYVAFADDFEQAEAELKQLFPKARLSITADEMHNAVVDLFSQNRLSNNNIQLHIKGTPFQIKVWEALLKIPAGQLVSYGQLAGMVGHPKAARAVGSAVGDNPIACLIPCHRVIQSGGQIGQYHWGTTRKTAIIGWEAAQNGI